MKKIAFLLSVFIFYYAFPSYAQKNENVVEKGHLGITFSSFGDNDITRFHELVGAASYNSDKFYTLGITYLYKLSKVFDVETGVEYSNHKIIIKPNLPPDMNNTPYRDSFSLINIPLTLRVNFLRYCFINGGILFDMDVGNLPVDSQTGIGAILGLGLKYDFKSGISVFANPYLKAHSLIPFSSWEHHQRLMEDGNSFRFGVIYRLK